jgi:chaperonin GroEL
MRTDAPEFLDDGATIARRMIGISDRSADVGAMILRNAMWKMHQEVGDGTTTMAILFQSILEQSVRAVVTGECDPIQLKRALENDVEAISAALHKQAVSLSGREHIARAAQGLAADPELANMLGEVLDIVGAYGTVNIETNARPELEREYIEGTYWKNSGLASPLFQTDTSLRRAVLDNAYVLVSNASIQTPDQLIPSLDCAVRGGVSNLVVIGLNFSGRALGLLLHNRQAGVLQGIAVRAPHTEPLEQANALHDIALLTGARFINSAAGETLERAALSDFGRVRRAWATTDEFGIVGGKGAERSVRKHLADLKQQLNLLDGQAKEHLQQRLGHLLGGVAILRVGAATDSEAKTRLATAERAVRALRNIVASGVVPGGGSALVACQCALSDSPADDSARAASRRILSQALEQPLRVIAANAGYRPDNILMQVSNAPHGHGLDAHSGEIRNMYEAGIVDSAAILEQGLRVAVSGAAMVFTTDVIVHHKRPTESIEP